MGDSIVIRNEILIHVRSFRDCALLSFDVSCYHIYFVGVTGSTIRLIACSTQFYLLLSRLNCNTVFPSTLIQWLECVSLHGSSARIYFSVMFLILTFRSLLTKALCLSTFWYTNTQPQVLSTPYRATLASFKILTCWFSDFSQIHWTSLAYVAKLFLRAYCDIPINTTSPFPDLLPPSITSAVHRLSSFPNDHKTQISSPSEGQSSFSSSLPIPPSSHLYWSPWLTQHSFWVGHWLFSYSW